jgi:hypothetical protein
MYVLGLVKNSNPQVLIDPQFFEELKDLYDFLTRFLSKDNFALSEPITLDSLTDALSEGKPVTVPFNGHEVILIMGKKDMIASRVPRIVRAGLLEEFMMP